ncbi:hypothetical protein RB195_025212 [Necator americanus]|uniref:Endoplasmic reticulum junction formation protein lunapark n=1 Tax=Necator americanus TaxID=51031 RepID=A0ABR1ERA8_NECAM
MGNILRRRKKVLIEELETLSQQMKVFRDDIEKTAEAKRMILWYLTLSTFFLSSFFVAYAWITLKRKDYQVLFSVLSFIAGLILLWFGRRIANAFYNWRISRKRQGLDVLVARKNSLLEAVKETETFKVAKEILEKYDHETVKSSSQPSSQSTEKRSAGNQLGQLFHPDQSGTLTHMDKDLLDFPSVKKLTRSFESIPTVETKTMRTLAVRSELKPIRPFQRESTSMVDKIVDYFFGDGPSQRFALICSNCHGHNGMAVPAEYDYLAFVCFICGYFNPAKKFRPDHFPSTPVPTISRVSKPAVKSVAQTISSISSVDRTDETKEEY